MENCYLFAISFVLSAVFTNFIQVDVCYNGVYADKGYPEKSYRQPLGYGICDMIFVLYLCFFLILGVCLFFDGEKYNKKKV